MTGIEIIARPRAAGKTYELIQRMKRDETLTYIAPTYAQAYAAYAMAQGLGIDLAMKRFVSAQHALRERERIGEAESSKRHSPLIDAVFGNVDSITFTASIKGE